MTTVDEQRPDPDALLVRMHELERSASRGKLRIYFGASAGVGKTYAMLNAARKQRGDGRDVVIGIVETHGRNDTEALLDGLDTVPRKIVNYRGKATPEFDVDAALARRPSLMLVDELAHSNTAGSRHPKRWQDVDELLDAGIDVFTTVNVQHLESLNDVVGGITGVRVAETVPDTVFDAAEEVVLVDVPVDELLARLKTGKVYPIPQATRALQNFFRKGNLIALRELALRRTADRIENDVQTYRIEKSIDKVWQTDANLLACVGPRAGSEHIIRGTALLASQLNAQWHAVYVETPSLQRLPSGQREHILKALKLAQNLGATTTVLTGVDIAREIVDYARNHNFSRIVVGRPSSNWMWRRTSYFKRISVYAPDIDLIQTGQGEPNERITAQATNGPDGLRQPGDEKRTSTPGRQSPVWRYAWTVAASVFTALLATPLLPYFDLVNIIMLFLLTVVLVGVRLGRGPAVLAAFLNVAVFDLFFVPPRLTFAVSDLQYFIVFAVMLAVGLITGQLAAGLRFQARIASRREERARALYEFARELSSALQAERVFAITRNAIQHAFQAKATLLLPNDAGRLQPLMAEAEHGNSSEAPTPKTPDIGIAQWVFDHAEPAGYSTDTLPASDFFYLPLIAPMRTRGVLAILPEDHRWVLIPERRRQLDTFAVLAAIALERTHYIEVAQDALVHMESERLRSSLLAALSHDLRTPLTSLVGLSESLSLSKPPLTPAQQQLVQALHEESLRMCHLVYNLMDMARIESGEVKLNLQWQHFAEVVGSALRSSRSLLIKHSVQTRLAQDLPLVRFDAMLIERVLCNLLENAAKYTPVGSCIVISAHVSDQTFVVSLSDNGPGLPAGREEAIFEKFVRGERASTAPGVGLGLAICRAIIEAHHGEIHGQTSPKGGATLVFTLPLDTPPPMPDADEDPEQALEQTL